MVSVLIVDDSKIIYQGLQSIIAREKDIYLVGYAADGKQALEKLEKLEKKPDVVLLDAIMPVMSGVEAAQEITRLFPQIKIIILSGCDEGPIALEAIAAGAKGYLLKNAISKELATAIRSVHQGSTNFDPGIINNLVEAAVQNLTPVKAKSSTSPSKRQQKTEASAVSVEKSSKSQDAATSTQAEAKVLSKPSRSASAKKNKKLVDKPLFKYGDWLTIIISMTVLAHMDGMGHHLAHAGLFCLALSLVASSIKSWWSWPLKHRRAIGIFAFATTVAHSFYATFNILDFNWQTISALSLQSKWGIAIGIISLLLMTPAAITSFKFFQQRLGRNWRKLHLLSVPALSLAVVHTVFAGPHYLGITVPGNLDYLRTLAVFGGCFVVYLMRGQFFESMLDLKKKSQKSRKPDTKIVPQKTTVKVPKISKTATH